MKKLKIRTQLLLMSLIPLLLLGLSLCYFTSKKSVETNIQTATELNESNTLLINNEFTSVVTRNLYVIEDFAVSPTIVGYMLYREQSGVTSEIVEAYLATTAKIMGDDCPTAIIDSHGQQLFNTGGPCIDVSDKDYFKAVMSSGSYYITDVFKDSETNERVACIAVPIFDIGNTNVVGVVQHYMSMSYLHDFLVSHKTTSMKDCFIVDSSGMVAAHSEHDITEEEDRSDSQFMKSDENAGTYVADTGDGKKTIISFNREPTTKWCYICTLDYNTISKKAVDEQLKSLIITILALIVCCLIDISLIMFIMKPMNAIDKAVLELSDGKFQRIHGFELYHNEFGNIVRNTNHMTDKIREIINSVKEAVDKVALASDELANTSKQISSTTDDVSDSIQAIAKGATEQATTIQKAVENVIVLSDNVKSVNDKAYVLSKTAKNMDEQSNSSANQISKLSESMNLMSNAMNEINNGIQTTGQAVNTINVMLNSITNIASQTSLLALNASIEAARAGDAGKGFAVVAEEIGNLATESAETAEEIYREMQNLLEASNNSTKKAKDVEEISNKVRGILSDTITIVDKLIAGVKETSIGISTISDLSKECESSKVIITEAMEVLSSISQENAASSQETSASMEEVNSSVNLLADSAQELNNLSTELDDQLKFFKL